MYVISVLQTWILYWILSIHLSQWLFCSMSYLIWLILVQYHQRSQFCWYTFIFTVLQLNYSVIACIRASTPPSKSSPPLFQEAPLKYSNCLSPLPFRQLPPIYWFFMNHPYLPPPPPPTKKLYFSIILIFFILNPIPSFKSN